MNITKKEASSKHTHFEPYFELSKIIDTALSQGFSADQIISTLVFSTEELARISNNHHLIGEYID